MRFELHCSKFNKCECENVCEWGWRILHVQFAFVSKCNQPTNHPSSHTSIPTSVCRMVGEWKCLCHLTRFHFSDKWNHLISDFNFRNEILWLLLPCRFEPCLTRLICVSVWVSVFFVDTPDADYWQYLFYFASRACMHAYTCWKIAKLTSNRFKWIGFMYRFRKRCLWVKGKRAYVKRIRREESQPFFLKWIEKEKVK